MTPDQLDRLQLAILNMVLLDDGEDPITLAQLQAENAKDPTEAAEQRAKVAKLAAAVLHAVGFEALLQQWQARADELEERAREADSIGEMPTTVLVLERRSEELRRVARELGVLTRGASGTSSHDH